VLHLLVYLIDNMKISKSLHRNRPVIYGVILGLGFGLLINISNNQNPIRFVFASIVLYIILLFELLNTEYHAKTLLEQLKLPPIDHDVELHTIHHLLIPSQLFFGLAGFIYFNSIDSLNIFVLTVSIILFSILFTNIRAYYEDKFKLEMYTHHIYDAIGVVISFLSSNLILFFFKYFGLNLQYASLPIVVLYISSILFNAYRYKILNAAIIQNTVISAGLVLFFNIVFVKIGFNVFYLSFLNAIFNYFVTALIIHKVEDTFNRKTIFEYFVVFLLLVVLIGSMR